MKKIFFAISFLGLNCLAYAIPSVENTNTSKILKFSTCYTQTITQYENSAGEYVRSVAGPRVSVECASGQLAGSTKTSYTHQLDPYADLWPY